jgi:hypothetical protein
MEGEIQPTKTLPSMVTQSIEKFPIEEISDEDLLYCRVHIAHIDSKKSDKKEKIMPRAFDPTPYESPDGLSTNWSNYSTALETKMDHKCPEKIGVVSFKVILVREIPLNVEHDPIWKPSENKYNQAHTLIKDIPPRKVNDLRITMKLRDICEWVIEIDT